MKKISFLAVLLLSFLFSSSQVTTNGGSGLAANYPTLAAAITALNGATITSPVIITLTGNETAPNGTGYYITATGTNSNTITIQGSSSTITAGVNVAAGYLDAIFKIVGGDYITIQNFNMVENASNTVTATGATNTMTEAGVLLIHASATNGAQNNTIQNNTITLSSAYPMAVGVFSTSSSSTTSASPGLNSTLDATSTAGTNSNNKIYGNTISGVALGVYFISPPITATINESGNDIGGLSLSTANNITFGNATAVTSAWNRSFTNIHAGIAFRNGAGNSARFNTINSYSKSYVGSAGVFGIMISSGTAPSGVTYTSNFSDNNITLTNTGTTAVTAVDFGHGITTGTIISNNNIIVLNQNCTAASSGAVTGIKASYSSSTNTCSGNNITINQSETTGALSSATIGIDMSGTGTTLTAQTNTVVFNQTTSSTTAVTTAITGIKSTAVGTTVNIGGTGLGNTITIKQAVTGSGTYGSGAITFIDAAAGHGTLNIVNNTLNTTGSSLRTTGTTYGIGHSGTITTALAVTDNIINIDRSGATATSGTFYGIYSGSSTALSNNYNVNTNSITLISISSGTTAGIYNTDGGNPTKNFYSNSINISGSGSTIYGMYLGYGTSNVGASGQSNIFTISSSGASPSIYGVYTITSGTAFNINYNTFNNISASAAGTSAPIISVIKFGVSAANTVSYNTICGTSTGAGTGVATIKGIDVAAGTTTNIYKNKIYGLSTANTGTTSTSVYAISIAAGATNNVNNNLIGINASMGVSATDAIRGISITSSTATSSNNIYYNTIYINATSAGTNFGTTGIYHTTSSTATTSALDLRNNIVVNNSTAKGTGLTVAYRRNAAVLTNYSSTSNNNLYYAGTPGAANQIFNDGTNALQTIVAYKALTGLSPRDQLSVTENPPFISTNGADATFLHIGTITPTQVESGAAYIASVLDDFDIETRNTSTPDIGADEGNFTMADFIPPAISYTNISNTGNSTNQSFNVTITDASGVNIVSGTAPRVYYKRSTDNNGWADNTNATNGWKWVECTSPSGNIYNFNLDYSKIYNSVSRPVQAGDYIQYFVVAQDIATSVNTGTKTITFGGTPANVADYTGIFGVTGVGGTPDKYWILPSQGTYAAGSVGDNYMTLTAANGFFAAMNDPNTLISGDITLNITADITTEDGTNGLNQWVETGGTQQYDIIIKPNSTTLRTISGANASNGLIRLNGADRVTFDGSAGTTNRYLTIVNTNASNATIVFINDACSNLITYSNVNGSNTVTSSGVILFSTATTTGNNNNTISFCDINQGAGVPYCGISSYGSASYKNSSNTIKSNTIRNFTGYGIYLQSTGLGDGWIIGGNNASDGNMIYNEAARSSYSIVNISVAAGNNHNISNNNIYQTAGINTLGFTGILLGGAGNGSSIKNNYIGGSTVNCGGTALTLSYTANPTFTGISISNGTTTAAEVQGNTISNISLTGSSAGFYGIYLSAGIANIGTTSGNNIGSPLSATSIQTVGSGSTYPIYVIGSGNGSNISNNIIAGITTTAATTFAGIYLTVGTTTATQVQGNTIKKISMNNNVASSFKGIWVTAGKVNIGDVSGNNIGDGSLSDFSSIVYSGNSTCYGIYSVASSASVISNNTVANIYANYNLSGTGVQVVGICHNANYSMTINGNTVKYLKSNYGNTSTLGVSSSIIGISVTSTVAPVTINQNIVHTLKNVYVSTSVVSFVTGIYASLPTSGTNSLSRNLINSLSVSNTNAGDGLCGLQLSAGVYTCDNNILRLGVDETGADINNNYLIYGIYQSGATATSNIYYNTVYIGGSSVGSGSVNTYSLYRSTTIATNVKNNIFMNARSNASGTGTHYAVYISAVTGYTANNNLFYTPGTGGKAGLMNATACSDLITWKNNVPSQDALSRYGDPAFVLANGSNSTLDLRLKTDGTSSAAESGGTEIAGITYDFYGAGSRPAGGYPLSSQVNGWGLAPDMGADEADAVGADMTPPTISYTVIPGTSSVVSLAFSNVTITDASGVNSNTGTKPRCYFKKSTNANTIGATNDNTTDGWKYVESNGTSSPFDFTIDYSLINGGVAQGNTIQYFVVAQDLAPAINVGINSGSFASQPAGVALIAANTPIGGTINSYVIKSNVKSTYFVGTGNCGGNGGVNDYATLTGAAGLFAAFNGGTIIVDKNFSVIITSNITETGANALNQMVEDGNGPYSMTISPCDASLKTLSGAIAGSLITLNGADRVIIDGRFNQTGTASYLSIINTQAAAVGNSTIKLYNDAQDNIIEYCTIKGNNTYSTTPATGIVVFGNAATGGTGNSGNTIDHCSITTSSASSATVGIYSGNSTAGTTNSTLLEGNTITNNNIYDIISSTASDGYGIMVTSSGNGPNWNISYNNFYSPTNHGTSDFCIDFEPGSSSFSNNINYNLIGGNAVPVGGAIQGTWTNTSGYTTTVINPIFVNVGGSNPSQATNISYNQIKNFTTTYTAGAQDLFVGIQTAGGYLNITYNTIGDASSQNNILNQCALNTSTGYTWDMSYIYGIWNTSSNDVVIDHNIVAGLKTTYNYSYVCGIRCGAQELTPSTSDFSIGKNTITNNTVGNLFSASQSESYAYPGGNTGIMLYSNSNNNLVESNVIAGISAFGTWAYNVRCVGLCVEGDPATHAGGGLVSKNSIYSVINNNHGSSTLYNPQSYGILTGFLNAPSGESYFTFSNNMISLSNTNYDASNDLSVVGIRDMNIAPSNQKYYYNSVYLTGVNGSSGTNYGKKTSSCFYSDYALNLTIKDNVFVNGRTGGTGTHRAIVNGGASWGSGACDNNFLATANRSQAAYWTSTTDFNTWKANSGADANSSYAQVVSSGSSVYSTDPAVAQVNPNAGYLFVDPADFTSVGKFLHIATADLISAQFVSDLGADLSSVGITTDYDGESRGSTPDIGADEFIMPTCMAPTSPLIANITSSSADISWTAPSSGSVVGYNWEVRTSGTGGSGSTGLAASGSTLVPIVTSTATGLNGNTNYTLYVRSDCGSGSYSSWVSNTFTTFKSEPSNQATNFAAGSVTTTAIPLTWTAAVAGAQAPDGYLVKLSAADLASVADPADGTDPTDITGITGGIANVKVTPGSATGTATFTGMTNGTMYFYKLYTYTNTGTHIDFNITSPPSLYQATLPVALTSVAFTATSGSTANITWTNTGYNSAGWQTLVFVKQGATAVTAGTPTNAPSYYSDNTTFGLGTAYQNDAAAYCVYNGDGTSVSITGLNATTTYQVLVYTVVAASNSNSTNSYSAAASANGVTPCDAISTFPWMESFEGLSVASTLPSCMTASPTVSSGGKTRTYIASATGTNSALTARTGSKFAAVYWSPSATGGYFFSPPLQLTGGVSYTASAYYLTDGTAWTNATIYYGTSATTGAMTNTIATVANAAATTYTQITGTFTPSVTGTYYVAVCGYNSTTSPNYISFDDLSVSLTPTCFPPSGLAASLITSSSATISWNAASPVPGNGYDYYYSTSSTAPTSGTTPLGSVGAGVLSAGLTGLTSSTTYYYWVRSNCGSGNSSVWSSQAVFTTPCPNVSLTYTQGFNATSIPSCWTQQYITGSSNISYVASSSSPTTTPYEGADYVFWNSFSITSGNETRLITPPITTTSINSVDVTFYWYNENSTSYNSGNYLNEGVQVQYSTDGNTWTDAGSFIARYDVSLSSGTGQWKLKTITLPAGAGNQPMIYVGFKFHSSNGDNCSMDKVVIKATPTCFTPTGLSSSSVSATTAVISWAAASPAPSDGYDYYYSTSSTAPTSGTTPLGSVGAGILTANLSSLTGNTLYYYWVRSNCGAGGYSDWSGSANFTTYKIEPSNQATNFAAGTVTTTAIPLTWTAALTGAQAPDGYLVKLSTTDLVSVVDPSDGNDPVDVTTITGGMANKKVTPGTAASTTSFTGMTAGTMYYYKLYTYTNTGTHIDFNTTSPPTLYNATLPTAVSAVTFSASSPVTANIGWTNTGYNSSDWQTLVFVKQGTSAITAGTPTFAPSYYTANTALGSGTAYQNDAAAYCVYNGDGSSVSISGLNSANTYQVLVYTVVAASNSNSTNSYSSSAAGSGITPCYAASVPFTEGFESGYTDQAAVAGCWTQEAVTTTYSGTYGWTANSSLTTYNRSPRTGSWNAYLHYSAERWMFYPLQLTGLTTYVVKLYARQDGSTTTDANITVAYGSSPSASSMTNTVVATTGLNSTYQLITGNFTPLTSGTYYVGIKGYINGTPYYISIDDISVTESLSPTLSVSPVSINFGNISSGLTSSEQTYSLNGSNLTGYPGNITLTAPTGFEVSLTSGSGFGSSLSVPYSSATLAPTTVYTRFVPTQVQSYTGNISNAGGGATTVSVAVSGTGGPANDAFANATSLPCGTSSLAGTTVNTSSESTSFNTCTISGYGVWYNFTGDGQLTTISTTATFDQKMAIVSGTYGSFTTVQCVDATSGAGTETYTFNSAPGTNYYVYIAYYGSSGTSSNTGTFTISRTCTSPPANDVCTNATALPCGTASLAGTTVGTYPETPQGSCSISGYGVWYTFVGDGQYNIITTTATFDQKVSILTGSCGSLTNVYCIDATSGTGVESQSFYTTNGVNYYVYVAYYNSTGTNTNTGTFTISRNCVTPPANDQCSNATSLTIGAAAISGTLAGANYEGPYFTSKKDVWYKFVPTCNGTYNITLNNLTDDIDLYTFADCSSASYLNISSNSGTTDEVISQTCIAGTTYYIAVYDYSNTGSSFKIKVAQGTVTATAPANFTGSTSLCSGVSATYSVDNFNGTTYNWTLPSGWTGTSTSNTINVTSGSNSGNISVTATNTCGTSSATSSFVTVNPSPYNVSAGSSNSVCLGSSVQLSGSGLATQLNSLQTTLAGGNGCSNGNMFNVTAGTLPVTITGFNVVPEITGTQTVAVYRKTGTYVGSESNSGAWTLVGNYSINGTAYSPVHIDVSSFTIPASTTFGIYVNFDASYTTISSTTNYSDANITIATGVGFCSAFGTPNSNRAFNGTVFYSVSTTPSYSWSPSTSLSNASINNPTATPSSSTLYTLTVSSGGCTSTASTNVSVNMPDVTNLTSSGNDFVWTGGTNGNWNTNSNWYNYNGTDFIPATAPNSNIANIFIRPWPNGSSCTMQNQPTLNIAVTQCNNLTIGMGATLTLPAADALTIYGNLVNDGTFSPGSGNVLTFAGNADATISGSGSTVFSDFVLNKGTSNSLSLYSPVVISHMSTTALSLNSGILSIESGGSLTVNNSGQTINNGATLLVNGGTLTGNNGTWANKGVFRIVSGVAGFGSNFGNSLDNQGGSLFDVQGGTLNIAGRLMFSGSQSATISGGTINIATIGNSSTSGSFDMSLNSNIDVTGTPLIVFQTDNTNGTDIKIVNGTGVKNFNGGTFQFGNASTPVGQSFSISSSVKLPNITINGYNSPTLTLTADLPGSNIVSINSGGTFNSGNFNLTIGGGWVNNGTFVPGSGTVIFNGTTGTSAIMTGGAGSGKEFKNLNVNTANIVNLGGDIKILGNFILDAAVEFNANSYAINIAGDFVHNAGTFTPAGSSVTLTGSGKSISGTTATSFNNLIVSGSYSLSQPSVSMIKHLGTGGNINIGAGASFAANDKAINIQGDFINSGTFDKGTGTVSFNGDNNQNITGVTQFYNLSIANTGSTFGIDNLVNLANPVTVYHNLSLNSGIIKADSVTSGNILSISDGATSDIGTTTSFVWGLVKKSGNNDFTFPVGDVKGTVAKWAPVGITELTGTGDFYGRYSISSSPNNWDPQYMSDTLDRASGNENWELDGGSTFAKVVLYWKDATWSQIGDASDLRVGHWNSTSMLWENLGIGSFVIDGPGMGHITSKFSTTSYSPFTFASKNGATNPLPVDLSEFSGSCKGNFKELKWTTFSETNNDYFTIEGSSDGLMWNFIAKVNGAGNSNTIINYTYNVENSDNIKYFRLKQTDFNGSSKTYSPVTVVCDNNEDKDILVYPNPFQSIITVNLINIYDETVNVKITDMYGKVVESSVYRISNSFNNMITVELDDLPSGIYYLDVKTIGFNKSAKIIKNK